ncbi:MAG: hypothetical protein ACK56I_04245, partial [bacterium]
RRIWARHARHALAGCQPTPVVFRGIGANGADCDGELGWRWFMSRAITVPDIRPCRRIQWQGP